MRNLVPCSLLLSAAVLAGCASDDVSSPSKSFSEMSQAKAGGDPLPKLSTAELEETDFPGLPEAAQKFQITLRFINTPTADQQAQFEQAASRWEGIIHGDVLETVGTIPANGCGPNFPLPAFTGVIDDIMINVLLQPIDGPGAVLGAAGACFVRTNDGLPLYGLMFFDTDDLAFLEQNNLLDEVITHEMGHVLASAAASSTSTFRACSRVISWPTRTRRTRGSWVARRSRSTPLSAGSCPPFRSRVPHAARAPATRTGTRTPSSTS